MSRGFNIQQLNGCHTLSGSHVHSSEKCIIGSPLQISADRNVMLTESSCVVAVVMVAQEL